MIFVMGVKIYQLNVQIVIVVKIENWPVLLANVKMGFINSILILFAHNVMLSVLNAQQQEMTTALNVQQDLSYLLLLVYLAIILVKLVLI